MSKKDLENEITILTKMINYLLCNDLGGTKDFNRLLSLRDLREYELSQVKDLQY